MLLGERGSFYVGERPDQMYVEYQRPGPGVLEHATPIVLYHGRAASGAVHWSHRAGDQSFALYLVAHGWPVYVVDCPGHGRSPFRRRFGEEATLDSFMSSGVALLERIGQSILVTTDMSARLGWGLAGTRPDLVAAVASWEPATTGERYSDSADGGRSWSAGIVFPDADRAREHAVPESSAILRELGQTSGVGPITSGVPALVVSADVREVGDPWLDHADRLKADYRRLPAAVTKDRPFGTVPLPFADVLFLWLAGNLGREDSGDDSR